MLQRWDPFNDLRQMQNSKYRMWRRFGNHQSNGNPESPEIEAWAFPLDVVRKGDDTVIRASVPGIKPEDIQVSIEDNVLTIRGHTAEEHQDGDGTFLMRERRSGSFHRALRLPESVDVDKVQPHYLNGVLTITVPKAEAKKAKQLQVHFSNSSPTQEA